MYNMYEGKTCLIVGNGPSLCDTPERVFGKFASFGTNKIFLHKSFKPTFYVAVNPLVLAQSIENIKAMECTKFVRKGFEIKAGGVPLMSMPTPLFSYDPLHWVYEGHTVTFVCLQLAFYMGFKCVYLIGVDHKYTFEGEPNEKQVFEGEDVNHFDATYFTGQEWHTPDLVRSEQAYEMAKVAFESVGRKIINLTPRTELEVFERKSWNRL